MQPHDGWTKCECYYVIVNNRGPCCVGPLDYFGAFWRSAEDSRYLNILGISMYPVMRSMPAKVQTATAVMPMAKCCPLCHGMSTRFIVTKNISEYCLLSIFLFIYRLHRIRS